MRTAVRRRKRIVAFTLTELMLLLVFVLLTMLAATPRAHVSVAACVECQSYRARVDSILGELGVSVPELIQLASRLVPEELLSKDRRTLVEWIDGLLAENRRLRRQIESAADGGGDGTEPGSCWESERGGVEFFLAVGLLDDGVSVNPAWPDHREGELRGLGVLRGSVPNGEVNVEEFSRFAEPIYFRTLDHKCRLFVRLTDFTTTKEFYKDRRRLIEKYFFIQEGLATYGGRD